MNSEVVYKDETFIAFKDISPRAPIHVLIIPKKHIASVNDLKETDKELIGGLILTARKVAEKLGIKDQGYKLTFNIGRSAGQIIDHIHLHVLGGWQTEEKMHEQKTP